MTFPRRIINWLTSRLDELERDTVPLEPNNNNYNNFLRDYVLPDIDAKRRTITRHQPIKTEVNRKPVYVCCVCVREIIGRPQIGDDDCSHEMEPWPCNAIRETAAPFAGQLGYRPEWAPDNVTPTRETGDTP